MSYDLSLISEVPKLKSILKFFIQMFLYVISGSDKLSADYLTSIKPDQS